MGKKIKETKEMVLFNLYSDEELEKSKQNWLVSAQHGLYHLFIKSSGMSSRKVEDALGGHESYKMVQKKVNEGKEVFQRLYHLIKAIEISLPQEKLEELLPHLAKYSVLTHTEEELEEAFEKYKILPNEREEMLEYKRKWEEENGEKA